MEDTRPAHAPAMAEGPNVGMAVESSAVESVWSGAGSVAVAECYECQGVSINAR